MHVKNGSKDLKRYPQISRRVRDTLARLFSPLNPGWIVQPAAKIQSPEPRVDFLLPLSRLSGLPCTPCTDNGDGPTRRRFHHLLSTARSTARTQNRDITRQHDISCHRCLQQLRGMWSTR